MNTQRPKTLNFSKKGLKNIQRAQLINPNQLDPKEVEELNLIDNHLESTDHISLLCNLKSLNLESNSLGKLGHLPKTLETLNAARNKLTELFTCRNGNLVSSFDQMANLKHLVLSRNNISKLHTHLFQNCQSLTYIDLSYNEISGGIDCFSFIERLKESIF